MKILTVGGATTDIFIVYKDASRLKLDAKHECKSFLLFEEGQKIEVDTLSFHTGGGATNSAVSFKRLGFDVAIFCKIGADKPAEFIMQRLTAESINLEYVKMTQEQLTGHSFIIPCATGDRVVLAYRGANAHLTLNDLPLKALAEYKNIYITALSGRSSQLFVPLTHAAKQQGALVANNPGTSQLALGAHEIYEALPNIDIFILNSEEACTFMFSMMQQDITLHKQVIDAQSTLQQKKPTQQQKAQLLQRPLSYQSICFDIRLFFKEVLSRGPKIVIVTNGAEGVYVATPDEIIFHPSLPDVIANTLGAGDAFGSCFVAKYIQGASIEDAMLYGILNASSVISHMAAKTGLLTTEELEERFKKVAKNLFSYFDF